MWQKRVELLVVISVIALLIALLLPAIRQAQEAAHRSQSKNNLKQIGLALQNYDDVYKCLPPGGIFDAQGRGYHGWMVTIIPYLEASPVYIQLDIHQPWDSSRNAGILLFKNSCYTNPGEDAKNTPVSHWEFHSAHYSANAHLLAANSCVRLKEIDSWEQTFVVGELAGDFVPWACPYNWRPLETLNGTPPTYGRYSKNGGLFLFVDGHAEMVSNDGFPALRESLRGPDLAGFGYLPANIVRPRTFPCPKDALVPQALSLTGGDRFLFGRTDYRDELIRITDRDRLRKFDDVVVHDADFSLLTAHHELEELDVFGNFTNAALPSLRALTHLRKLHLKSNEITVEGLSFVDELANLEVLIIEGQSISPNDRQSLRERLRKMTVLPNDSEP